MERVYNFSAGPACLPIEVLKQAQDDFISYGNSGMNVMEMSHRSKEYQDIIDTAEADLRDLMNIPDNYSVLFLQGGASLQFAMVPLNLMTKYKKAHFVKTGQWAKKAIEQAKKFGEANVVASSEDKTFSYIPQLNADMFTPDADYVHITSNNTIYGTRFTKLPPVGDLPLVSDMSSCILSEEINVADYALIYAGAQKNIGPAGVTIVIIRNDLIGHAPDSVPTMLNYKTYADNGSMFNTPPTYAIYIAGLVFKHLKKLGGVGEMEKINKEKAAMLYEFIDNSPLFQATVEPKYRSLMNVPFITGSEELDKEFVAGAKKAGLVNLKGHRSVGGMRASIYNAMPESGVRELIAYMAKFEAEHK
ncbi:MAG: 3-phosphoserine/phosphohydroxythreonine transaminase [Christensenella hongkongensis]|uniref:Phosphoserine aminotransferase n=1 Tax=Christensenella hongkongensis TaxID=270498 RepID=A0A0M2NES7_9FIRM|nr:3-phosphoserine/phosphohydroxythreonine transaminase [Christensenella hongkongensis]KKI51014.1 Phosphoserine aminotransferase [Christensenella hongkongensis]MDY3004565.1 3-phosphoserine/phosphohydroxythreonine transaminase [Christensenella hongkongensis]TCW30568.1 phosphoserine aminotransferase [Christensenella hongkongensis]